MEPIPETVAAIEELGPFAVDGDLTERLREMGRRVRELVPDCVAFSLASREHGVTFALVATDAKIALLDALRHLDIDPSRARHAGAGGPGPARPPRASRRTSSTSAPGSGWPSAAPHPPSRARSPCRSSPEGARPGP